MQNTLKIASNHEGAKPLSLRPRTHPMIQTFLDREQDMIHQLADAFGSPLNIIFPEIINENIAAFQDVYNRHHIQGRIFYTTKPNKSVSVVKQAATNDVGVDVSSEEGLKIALANGFHPDRIECTGPKNAGYITLALQHNVIINVDNLNELSQIIDIRKAIGLKNPTRIFIRLCGFSSDRIKFTPHDGTFGIHINQAEQIFSILIAHKADFDFIGFSFHFNASATEQKLIAIETTLRMTMEAIQRGLNPRGINIGGGFDIQYAESAQEWSAYVETLKNSLRQYDAPSLNWNNSGLGFRNEGGLVKGAGNFMHHFSPSPGAQDLEYYMTTPLPALDNMNAAQVLNDCLLELYIEPGRALLDQLGITIGRVNFTKKSVHGENLVGLDMNRTNIHSTHQKLLTDPTIIYSGSNPRKPCPDGVYYTGNLCLSYDMITYNKTFPDFLPEPGDLVVFINTAAYIMDFVESKTLHQPVAEKIAIVENDGQYRWFRDEKYNPVIERMKVKS